MHTKQIPIINEISNLSLPDIKKTVMSNGISAYQLNMGSQEVLNIELVFRAGRAYESEQLIARTTAKLLKEGTKNFNSAEIAETIDFYGGTLSTSFNFDIVRLNLYCLTRRFDDLLPLFADVILNPIFPEAELKTFIKNSDQKLKVDLERSDVVAYRTITEKIFGMNHTYGYNSYPGSSGHIKNDQLKKHHQDNFVAGNCFMIISGKWNDDILAKLDQEILQNIPAGKTNHIIPEINSTIPTRVTVKNVNNLQASIRMGCKLFNRHHKDFKKMVILSTILGGYFGSRLMTNIREEKGYTYNIFSTIDAYRHDGIFYIGAEVAAGLIEEAIKEIHKEIKILQTELISDEELKMVRNYMLGNLLNMLDGPFNVAELVRTMVMDELPLGDYESYIHAIKTFTAEEMRDLAQKYLVKENMWEVVVN